MSWSVKYAMLIALATVITYLGALILDSDAFADKQGKYRHYRKPLFVFFTTLTLLSLFFFKYFNFAVENIEKVLSYIGVGVNTTRYSIVMPLGISFYTLQSLGYLIDVYRNKEVAERNFLRYALFVSFFPQLISGPIQRADSLLPQLKNCDKVHAWDLKRISSGLTLALWGYFLKLVIADRADIFVTEVYRNFSVLGSVELAIAAILYSLQIYCDFSGYSLIAIGTARAIGFELTENFNVPYFSTSIKEFWRRWHISLSTWFRDYIYISLGGSRCDKLKHYRNLIITFVISGLWHGASWNFVVWGLIHGVYQVVADLSEPLKLKIQKILNVNRDCFSYKFGQILITNALVCVAWIFFRMDSVMNALRLLLYMFTKPNLWVLHNGSLFTYGLSRGQMTILVLAIAMLFVFDLLRYTKGLSIDGVLAKQNTWFRWLMLYIILFMIIIYGVYGPTYNAASFIYSQF